MIWNPNHEFAALESPAALEPDLPAEPPAVISIGASEVGQVRNLLEKHCHLPRVEATEKLREAIRGPGNFCADVLAQQSALRDDVERFGRWLALRLAEQLLAASAARLDQLRADAARRTDHDDDGPRAA